MGKCVLASSNSLACTRERISGSHGDAAGPNLRECKKPQGDCDAHLTFIIAARSVSVGEVYSGLLFLSSVSMPESPTKTRRLSIVCLVNFANSRWHDYASTHGCQAATELSEHLSFVESGLPRSFFRDCEFCYPMILGSSREDVL